MPGATGSRFERLRPLGSGATSTVWLAHDRLLGVDVAIKALAPGLDAHALRRELRLLRDLQHENLVRLYEVTDDGDTPLLTMEALDGASLLDGASAPLASTARDVFLGLAALHDAGVVHGDVKPANVFWTRGGRAVLVDFGLASTTSGKQSRRLAGTLHYAAPEVIFSGRRGPASDVFSAGATLIEHACGQRAPAPWSTLFGGRPCAWWRDLVSAPLADVLGRAVHPDPEARPAAYELAEALGEPRTRHHPVPLIGRDDELAAAIDALTHERRSLAIVGGPGIGKTRLVDSIIAELRGRDIRVFRATCDPGDSLPFQALASLLDAISEQIDLRDLLAGVSGASADALAAAFPDLIGRRAESPHRVDTGALGAAIHRLLTSVQAKGECILAVDDAHWVDADSAHILGTCIGESQGGWLIAQRPDGHDVASGITNAGGRQIDLVPLTDDRARELARAIAPGLDGAALHDVMAGGRGSPFLVIEGARSSVDRRGLPEPDAEQLLIALASSDAPVPSSVLLAATASETATPLFALRRRRWLELTSRAGRTYVALTHDLIRARVLREAEPTTLEAAARNLAMAWSELPDAEPTTLARLFERGRSNAETARWARVAATRADVGLAFHLAAEMYALASRADPEAADDLVEPWGRAAALAGRPAEAAKVYLSGEGRHATGRRTALAANTLLASGDVRQGLPLLDKALETVDLVRPTTTVGAVFRFGAERARLALTRRGKVLDIATRTELQRRCEVVSVAASVYGIFDTTVGGVFQGRLLHWARTLGPSPELLAATAGEFVYAGVAHGSSSAARNEAEKELQALEAQIAEPDARAYASLCRGYEAFMTARFVEARARMSAAADSFSALGGVRWTRSVARVHVLLADTWLDAFDGLADRIAEEVENLRSSADELNLALLELGAGYLVELARDSPEAASIRLERAMRRWHELRIPALEYLYYRARANIDLFVGHDANYVAYAERLRPSTTSLRARAHTTELAWFAARTARGPNSRRVVEKAVRDLAGDVSPFGTGLRELLRSELARSKGDRHAEVAHARSALAILRDARIETYARTWARIGAARGWCDEKQSSPERRIELPPRWNRMLAPTD